MTQTSEFHQRFAGELGRVYPYLSMAPSLGAEKLFDLHHRHAEQVGKVMLAAMKEYAEPRRTGQLADTSVVNYAFDAGRLAAKTPKDVSAEPAPIVQPSAKEQNGTHDEGRKHRPLKDRFTFGPEQVLFDGNDLDLPTGLAIEVFKKLHANWGLSVPYRTLEQNSPQYEASDQLKGVVLKIRRAIDSAGIPAQIQVKPRAGYVLKEGKTLRHH